MKNSQENLHPILILDLYCAILCNVKLKILTYNIHKGLGWGRSDYFLPALKEFIQSTGADLVFLQEVVGANNLYRKRGWLDAQMDYLAESDFEHFSYALNARYAKGHHGNLILSRYPIESWENINLSTNFLEKRGLLFCRINLPSDKPRSLYAGCVHLDLFHRGRKIQYQAIQKKIKSFEDEPETPFILAGDFNDWNKAASKIFQEGMGMREAYHSVHGRYANTFPSPYPYLSLDRIYVRNLQVTSAFRGSPTLTQIRESKTRQLHLSDHLPLYCEVELD